MLPRQPSSLAARHVVSRWQRRAPTAAVSDNRTGFQTRATRCAGGMTTRVVKTNRSSSQPPAARCGDGDPKYQPNRNPRLTCRRRKGQPERWDSRAFRPRGSRRRDRAMRESSSPSRVATGVSPIRRATSNRRQSADELEPYRMTGRGSAARWQPLGNGIRRADRRDRPSPP